MLDWRWWRRKKHLLCWRNYRSVADFVAAEVTQPLRVLNDTHSKSRKAVRSMAVTFRQCTMLALWQPKSWRDWINNVLLSRLKRLLKGPKRRWWISAATNSRWKSLWANFFFLVGSLTNIKPANIPSFNLTVLRHATVFSYRIDCNNSSYNRRVLFCFIDISLIKHWLVDWNTENNISEVWRSCLVYRSRKIVTYCPKIWRSFKSKSTE